MLAFDIETDNLLDDMTKVHCINMVDRSTGERLRFNDQPDIAGREPDGSLRDGLKRLMDADALAGQNILNFDIPALQKVWPEFDVSDKEIHDTLVYSRIIWTNLKDIDFRAIKKKKRPPEWSKGCKFGSRKVPCTGRHSLGAWGMRLGDFKDHYEDDRRAEAAALGITDEDELREFIWGTFNPAMDNYCAQDVEVTVKLLEFIEKQGYDPEALKLEIEVANIIDQQQRHGVELDVEAAEKLAGEMTAQLAEIHDKLTETFKPWFAPKIVKGRIVQKTPTRRVYVNGTDPKTGEISRVPIEKGHAYCPVETKEFNPGSRDMIADRLTKLFGWTPQEFTKTGKPQVDEAALDGLDYPEVLLIKDYLALNKRLSYLATGDKALLKLVKSDGRIYGRVNSNGAVTGRMTHNSPNLAQVPKVKKDRDGNIRKGLDGGYGYELRSLFRAPEGYKLVGVDAAGLELRMLAHYMALYDDGEYGEAVVKGTQAEGTDAHTRNQRAVGLNSRDNAKTWMYAYLYGAGNFKLGATVFDDMADRRRAAFNAKYPGGPKREKALIRLGGSGRRKIESGLPALGSLQEMVAKKAKRKKFLRSLDGRKLHIRGLHSALNSLLQGGGAVVMKKALVIAYNKFLAKGWEFGREFAFVLNVHDEFQIEAKENLAEEIGRIAAEAIAEAGRAYNLRVPLEGSQDIGQTWAETH